MGKRIESPHFRVQLHRRDEPAPSVRRPERTALPARQKPLPRPSKPIPKKAKKKRVLTNGKVVRGHKLRPIVEDRVYLNALRGEPDMFTGLRATENDPVEAMHFGNPGKGLKSDNEAGPVFHSTHALTHREGITAILPLLANNPGLLLDMCRAYLRERYAIWKAEREPMDLTEETA